MQRTVTTPADLSGEALDELKNWLGISRPSEDPLLINLLGASLSLCEAYTGQTPLEQIVEERISPKSGQSALTTRPVQALLAVEVIATDGTRSALSDEDYDFELDASHTACLKLKRQPNAQSVAVTLRAGLAPDWSSLPPALKQGAIRLAAFHYRDRDAPSRGAAPPASVTALWRPWRALRVA